MLTSAIGDSRNKNAKNEDSKGEDNTEKEHSKARPPCFWGLRTANAFRVGHEAHWGRTKGYSNVYRRLLGGNHNIVNSWKKRPNMLKKKKKSIKRQNANSLIKLVSKLYTRS